MKSTFPPPLRKSLNASNCFANFRSMLKSLAISVLDECLTGKKKRKKRGAQVAKGQFIVTEKAVKERCLLSHRLVLERFVKPHKALIHKTFFR